MSVMYCVLSKLRSKWCGDNVKIPAGRFAVNISAGLSGYIPFHTRPLQLKLLKDESPKSDTRLLIYWELLEEYLIDELVNFSFFFLFSQPAFSRISSKHWRYQTQKMCGFQ
jgi:hypothetical protein